MNTNTNIPNDVKKMDFDLAKSDGTTTNMSFDAAFRNTGAGAVTNMPSGSAVGTTTALATVAPATTMDVAAFEDAFRKDVSENFAGVERLALPRVKIAPGGIGFFDFGENKVLPSFSGYIISHAEARAAWNTGDPYPVCTSPDGKISENGQSCALCPRNRFSATARTNPPQKAEECRTSLNLLIVIDGGGDLPYLLSASATSLKYWGPLAVAATKRGWPIGGCHVKFYLKKETMKNDASIAFSTLQYEIIGRCESAAEYAKLKNMAANFAPQPSRNAEFPM